MGRSDLYVLVFALVAACKNVPTPVVQDASPFDAAPPDHAFHDAMPRVTFAAKVDFATGANPTSIAVVDLDGDGKLDVVAANTNTNTLSIFHNTTAMGATTPTFDAATTVTVGANPASVAAGDINGDSKMDLVTANVGANTVTVLLGDGALGFATPATFAVGTGPEWVALGDVDGDGVIDAVTANVGANTLSVLRSTTGTGAAVATFAAKIDLACGAGPVTVAVIDIDGDGKRDLAAADLNADAVSMFLNTTTTAGSPTFAAKADFATGSQPNGLAARDVDGNGKVDFAVADSGGNAISLLINMTASGASTPAIAPKLDVPTGTQPDAILLPDLDGDGVPDLVTADFGANTASIVLDVPPGYGPALPLAAGAQPRALGVGDLNGDGKPDLIVANGGANSLSVFLAQ